MPGLPGRVREGFLEEVSLNARTGRGTVTQESKVGWREGHCREKSTPERLESLLLVSEGCGRFG